MFYRAKRAFANHAVSCYFLGHSAQCDIRLAEVLVFMRNKFFPPNSICFMSHKDVCM